MKVIGFWTAVGAVIIGVIMFLMADSQRQMAFTYLGGLRECLT